MAEIVQGSDGHYFLAFNKHLSHLTFDLSQSFMLSCGCRGHQFCAADAETLSSALVDSGLLLRPQLRLCCRQEECSTAAIQSVFKTQATRVGGNGLFIFAYHGSEPLSCTTIHSWLQALSPHPPKQIVFFLDCPSATETAKSLTNPVSLVSGVEKFCIFCANAQPCSSQLTSTLGHSLFSYFTSQAIRKCTPTPNQPSQRLLYISDISSLIKEFCRAVSSLCLPESDSSGPAVKAVRTQPLRLMQRCQDDTVWDGEDMIDGQEEEEGEEEVDGSTVARFSFVEKFYRTGRKKQRPKLCEMAHRWLEYLKHGETSPLHILCKHELLSASEMLTSVLRLLIYSLALIQESSEHRSTGDPNTLIVVYVQAVGLLEHVAATDLPATADQFELSCEAYCLALDQRKVNSSRVRELAKKVKKENQ